MATAERGLIKYESRGQQVELSVSIVRDFLVTGKKELVSEQEIFYFLGICKARQLNPFVKDCYLIKYGTEAAQIVTSIDFYRSRARAAKDCVGWEKGVICLHKETGEIRYSKGLVLPTETLVGGWFKARPVGWSVDFMLEVNLAGYIKRTAQGEITKFWSEANQPSQIMKVAESQGLRTVWPDLFQGTYTADEMSIDLDTPSGPPPPGSPGDITPPEEAKLDTSQFDKAVKKLKLDAEQKERLEKWLTDTAVGASNKAGKTITADAVKVSCGKRFDEFLAKFKEWQDVNYPVVSPGAEAGAAEKAEAEVGEPEQEPESGPEAKPFAERKEEAWRQVVTLGIPLPDLAVIKCPDGSPMSRLADIDEENIGELEKLIAAYSKKKK